MPAKLDPDTVRLLRRYYNHGYSIASLCRSFKLSRRCVHDVVNHKTHKNVTQDDALPPLVEIDRDKVVRMPDGSPKPKPDYSRVAEFLRQRR